MTKSELVLKLVKQYPHLQTKDIERLVNTVFNQISQALIDERRVELRGFGAFSLRKRGARKARNPKTGAEVHIEDRYALYFRPGKELRERVNKNAA